MFRCSVDASGRVLAISYSGHVTPEREKHCVEEVRALIDRVKPGFFLFVDMSNLESMEVECAPELAAIMDLCNSKGVTSVLRVIPDRSKDIGFNLISHFHYSSTVHNHTFDNLADALGCLLAEFSQSSVAS
jgi:anti-anti-sigma regulatory factor